LIIKHGIPRVIIGCRDPFKEVDGKGIDKLKAAGVETVPGILENECRELNKRFFVFHTQHRPFIILKWAQTADGFIAPAVERAKGAIVNSKTKRLLISNEYTKRVVHKWRSEEAGILVGTNTALDDDPELTTRLWPGNSPVRFVVDMHLRLPSSLRIFDQSVPTIVFNSKMHSEGSNWLAAPMGERVKYYQVTEEVSLVHQVINALYQLKIQSVIVEGGTRLLQSFIDEGLWDEARVIRNGELAIGKGLPAPEFVPTEKTEEISFLQDKLTIYRNSGK
jgi:diaminohydroxyphosphoribosylaminopyrimidine deaminase/5-amino-6-(5-phosphoribosylamino)uracil reductase